MVLCRVQHHELILKMTNLKTIDDHKICGSSTADSASPSVSVSVSRRRSEGGYTLVALLAMMTVLALFVASKWLMRSVITIVIAPELVAVSALKRYQHRWTNCYREYRFPAAQRRGRYFVPLLRAIH